ncbi:MAG: hypothetical protein U0X91_03600 [Spirosomataceae bacterium]
MANPTNMDSGVDFQTWNNHSRGGGTNTFKGTQGINSRDANDDSLQTSDNTWVIVFDKSNYTGNCWQIDQGKYYDNLHDNEIYDSNGNDTGNHWQGTINSFILYKQKPSWFVAGSSVVPSNEQLFELEGTQVLVCEDANFLGDNSVFTGPYTCPDVANVGYTTNSRYMSGAYAISSLKTGPNAWMIIFDHPQMKGDFKKIVPNSGPSTTESMDYSNLNNIERDDSDGKKDGDWNDQINSFVIYNYEPEFWNTPYNSPYIDGKTLYSLFPYPTNSESDSNITYMVEDSTYSVDYPEYQYQSADQGTDVYGEETHDDTSTLPQNGWTKYHVHMEHDIHFAWNDTADFDIYFDNAGNIVQIGNFIWTSNGAFDVPSTVIKSVDAIGAYLSASLDLIGVDTDIIDDFIEGFNFVCNAFNTIAKKVYQFSDNGGQFYFLPVICHTINRIASTVATQYAVPLYTDPSNVRNSYVLSFNNNSFPTALTGTLGNEAGSWQIKQGLDAGTWPFNQVSEYVYEGNNYRTWYQETSVSGSLGMFVSCKIDYEIGDDSKDDHVIILMGFIIPDTADTFTPVLSFAQATVQFTDGSNENIMTPAFNGAVGAPNYSTDIIGSVYQFITSKLNGISMSDSQQGRQYLADITQANMSAITQCMSYGA